MFATGALRENESSTASSSSFGSGETVICSLDAAGRKAVEKLANSGAPQSAIVFKCARKTTSLIVEDEFDSISPEELGDEVVGMNRLVVYRCGWKLPDQSNRAVPCNLLLWFNPAESCEIHIQRTYYPTMKDLMTKYPMVFKQDYQLNNVADFSEQWLKKHNFSLSFDKEITKCVYLDKEDSKPQSRPITVNATPAATSSSSSVSAPPSASPAVSTSQGSKFCSECGSKRPDQESLFCSDCGTRY